MMNMGRDVASFFPDVVKIIGNDHPELKKLVFNYLLHYASDNQVGFRFVCFFLFENCKV